MVGRSEVHDYSVTLMMEIMPPVQTAPIIISAMKIPRIALSPPSSGEMPDSISKWGAPQSAAPSANEYRNRTIMRTVANVLVLPGALGARRSLGASHFRETGQRSWSEPPACRREGRGHPG